jgi:polysaccharide biosynthesis protein PslH
MPSIAPTLRRLEERYRSYWGVPSARIAAFGALAGQFDADAVVVAGLSVLPMLAAIDGPIRIWYAADEWVWHHLTQVRHRQHLWENVRAAVVKGVYERVFRRRIDRAWVVSDSDARAFRRVASLRQVDTIPLGVDADFFSVAGERVRPDSAVFWGRLDFGPNLQALRWFIERVWPAVKARRARARFTVIGFRPTPEVRALAHADGVVLEPDVLDIRPVVARHGAVVLPFISGGGAKNKLLEAAAMGKAIVATPRTLSGLRGDPPVQIARTVDEWVTSLLRCWDDEAERRSLGVRARRWVEREHTWAAAGRLALDGIARSLGTEVLR